MRHDNYPHNNISINREQQRDLHNARVFFQDFLDRYEDVLSERVKTDFNYALTHLIRAHDPIRAEENKRFDERHDHFQSMKALFKFKTIWSDFDIERLDENLPIQYLDMTHVKYDNQLVAVEPRPELGRVDWLAVWKAADKAIVDSGDTHHVYVEGFYKTGKDPEGVYQVITGS